MTAMNDDEVAALLRRAAQEEDAAYETWAAGPEGRDALRPRDGVDTVVARAMSQVARPAIPAVRRPTRRPRRPVVLGFTGALAAAAAVALVARHAPVAPVPAYEVSIVLGAPATTRSAPDHAASLVYHAGDVFELALRPATRVAGAIDVRAALVSSAGSAPLTVEPTVNDAGFVRVRGTWPAMPSAAGTRELVIAVGRPDALPSDPAHATPPASNAAWQIVRIDVNAPAP